MFECLFGTFTVDQAMGAIMICSTALLGIAGTVWSGHYPDLPR